MVDLQCKKLIQREGRAHEEVRARGKKDEQKKNKKKEMPRSEE